MGWVLERLVNEKFGRGYLMGTSQQGKSLPRGSDRIVSSEFYCIFAGTEI